jgi:murein L,D-transpeptidase YcbB/YkuD
MFDKDERALSSGCIRVSQPEKLADFILSGNDKWSWNGMEKMIDSGRMRDVATKESLPVFITYQTVWLDSEGRLVYGTDVYGQDAKLSKMLKKSGSVHLPQASGKAAISL